jgi:hypothetical protein
MLLGYPDWKRTLRRPRSRWKKIRTLMLLKIGHEIVGRSEMAEDRALRQSALNTVMNIRVTQYNFLIS